MRWTRFCATVPNVSFLQARAAIESVLSLEPGALEDGIHQLEQTEGALSVAVDATCGFYAARQHSEGICRELFFVTPQSGAPRLGLAYCGGGLDIPAPLDPWLNIEHLTERAPSFTALSTLLARQGAATRELSIPDQQLHSECEYLKLLVADQAHQLRQVQAQLRDVRQRAEQEGSGERSESPGEEESSWNLSMLNDWCAQHENTVIVLPRARNGAKKSRYEDPSLFEAALEILAGPYRDLRAGRMTRDVFDALILPLGLRLNGSVSAQVAGSQGDEYFVTWAGRRRFLDLHLAKGGGRDERFCFRLYFFWDEASRRVVVGSMPTHLSNSLS